MVADCRRNILNQERNLLRKVRGEDFRGQVSARSDKPSIKESRCLLLDYWQSQEEDIDGGALKNEREVNLIYFPSQSFFRPCLITSSSLQPS
jgi:hypothetical protein